MIYLILPSFNEEKNLVKMFKKINNLSIVRNIVVILIDDCSSDNTKIFKFNKNKFKTIYKKHKKSINKTFDDDSALFTVDKEKVLAVNGCKTNLKITDQEDTYTDQIGWTAMEESFEDYEDPTPTEPEIVTHQCSMCGSTMKIPRPKRERYKVICAYPECGHSDMVGI